MLYKEKILIFLRLLEPSSLQLVGTITFDLL